MWTVARLASCSGCEALLGETRVLSELSGTVASLVAGSPSTPPGGLKRPVGCGGQLWITAILIPLIFPSIIVIQ